MPRISHLIDGHEETALPVNGRGSASNRAGRFEPQTKVLVSDGWDAADQDRRLQRVTEVTEEMPRHIITKNMSPDIGFDRSINPYRGCEHGCSYCYARPTHSYMGLSAGLDFETKLFAKPAAAKLLRAELGRKNYKPQLIALGTNTDPYQPIEKTRKITRSVLEVLAEHDHPVGIVTKNALVTRDIDILAPMAEKGLARVCLSVTTLDRKLARALEPRASTPAKRLDAIRQMRAAGIPTGVSIAPIIPGLTDHEMEAIMTEAHTAGADQANYILLRLPLEVRDLFVEWLVQHAPDRADRVMSLVRQTRGGNYYESDFGQRMRGRGPVADLIANRFALSLKRLGMKRERDDLRTDLFRPPGGCGQQLGLFP